MGIVEMWHIFAYNIARGMTMAFDQPARRAMIPTIVPTYLVTNAMALSTGSMTAMRIGGAAVAGILVATTGFGVTYAVMTSIYLVAIVFTWMLRPADHERSGYQGVRKMGGDFMDGLRYAWRIHGHPGHPDHIPGVVHFRDGFHAGVRPALCGGRP